MILSIKRKSIIKNLFLNSEINSFLNDGEQLLHVH